LKNINDFIIILLINKIFHLITIFSVNSINFNDPLLLIFIYKNILYHICQYKNKYLNLMNWFIQLFKSKKSKSCNIDFGTYDPKDFLVENHWIIRETGILDENHKIIFVISPVCRKCPYPHHLHLYLFYQIANSRIEFDRLIVNEKTKVLKSFDFEKEYGIDQRVLAFNIENGLALYEITNDPTRRVA